jgi:hypothetical protein
MKENIVKWKTFFSILKERDWLEEMAEKGWLLEKIDIGMRYHFKKIEPAKKVYEIENFPIPVNGNATKQEMMSRKTAFDIAKQTGWEIVAQDESMNYYFAKDKAGDESDEFYDDDESRRQRAEKFRRRYTFEYPHMILSLLALISVIYVCLFFILRNDKSALVLWMGVYIVVAIFEVTCALLLMVVGEHMYNELVMSREQWENRKNYSYKGTFYKVNKLLVLLQKKDDKGLSLVACEGNTYLFEKCNKQYIYYADTKKALKRRMKKSGRKVKEEKKDWERQSLWWYEMSIEEAKEHGLEVVCAVENGTLIYRKNKIDENINPWYTGAVSTGKRDNKFGVGNWLLICFIIGLIGGLCAGFLL